MFTRSIKFQTPYKAFIFLYKFENQEFSQKFKKVKVEFKNDQITLLNDNNAILGEAQKWIKNQISNYFLQIINTGNQQLKKPKIISLQDEFNIQIIRKEYIQEFLDQIVERNGNKLYRQLVKRLKQHKNFLIFIRKDNQIDVAKKIRCIFQPKIQLNLEIKNRKILDLVLIGFIRKIKQSNVKFKEQNQQTYLIGQKLECNKLKNQIIEQSQLIQHQFFELKSKNQILIKTKIQQRYEEEKIKGFAFIKDDMHQICMKTYKELQLKGPRQLYLDIYDFRNDFIYVVYYKKYENQASKIAKAVINGVQNEVQNKKKIKKKQIIVKNYIKLKYYDQTKVQRWFSQSRKINFKNIEIRENQDQIQVVLFHEEKNQNLIKSFNMFFQYQKIFFFEQQYLQFSKKVVDELKKTYDDYELQVVQGFQKIPMKQLSTSKQHKVRLSININKNAVTKQKIGAFRYKYQCLFIKGYQPMIQVIEKQFNTRIKQMYQDFISNQQWKVALPETVIKNLYNPKVVELVKDRIMIQIQEHHQSILCHGIELNQQQFVCKIQIINNAIYPFKSKFLEIIKTKFQQLKLAYDLNLNQVLEILDNENNQELVYCILLDTNQGVSIIGFENTGKYLSIIVQIIQRTRKYMQVKLTNSQYAIIKDYIENLKLNNQNIKIEVSGQKQKSIIIKGLQIKIQPIYKKIEEMRSQVMINIIKDNIAMTKSEYEILRYNNILKQQEQKYLVELKYKQCVDKNVEIICHNKNRFIFSTNSIIQSRGSVILIRNQYDLEILKKKYQIQPQFNINLINNKSSKAFDKTNRIFFIDQNAYNIQDSLNYIFSNCAYPSLAIYLDIHSYMTEINSIFQYIQKKQKLPVIILTCRNSQQQVLYQNYLKKVLKISPNQEKVKYNIGWIEDGVIKKYNKKAANKIIYELLFLKNFLIYLNQDDFQITQHTHIYAKSLSKMVHKRGGPDIPVIKKGQQYCYTLRGKQYKIPNNQVIVIECSPTDLVKLTLSIYELDFHRHIQTNVFTGFQRNIHMQKIKQQQKDILLKNYEYKKLKNCGNLQISAHKQHKQKLNNCKSILRNRLNQLFKFENEFKINTKIMTFYEIHQIIYQNNFYFKSSERQSEILIKMVLKHYQNKKFQQFHNKYKLKSLEYQSKIEIPTYWDESQQDIKLIPVANTTTQFQNIQQEFKIFPIIQLVRIQNNILWKKYSQQKKDIEKRSDTIVKQAFLFHGTRTNDPSSIYKDKQESFNINYAGDNNYFGRGIYFAKQASYSHLYRFTDNISKRRCILYCRVQVGYSQEMDISLKNPLIKDTTMRDVNKQIRFQSIHSKYDGSDIYIVYKSRRAYPEYLIWY